MTETLIQGSDAWRQARLGRATASRISDIIARTKSGWGASRANYAAELVAERLTGTLTDGFTNAAMTWGTEKEPDARATYEFVTDTEVKTAGFIPHPSIAMCGCSPDGLVASDGLVEIKCPSITTHIETLRGASVPAKYITQMQFQMACCNREWCDFVSFDPRMPEPMQLFIKRVQRDNAAITFLEKEIAAFLSEVDATVTELTRIYSAEKAA